MFGPFQRDASAAVNQATIPWDILLLLGNGGNQNFSGNTVSFFTLTGTGTQDDIAMLQGGVPRRAFSFVTYNGGTRTERWIGANGVLEQGPSRVLSGSTCKFTAYKVKDASGNVGLANDTESLGLLTFPEFPSFVTLQMQATSDLSSSYDVGAASAGPDRTFGTGPGDPRGKDDIRTWVE